MIIIETLIYRNSHIACGSEEGPLSFGGARVPSPVAQRPFQKDSCTAVISQSRNHYIPMFHHLRMRAHALIPAQMRKKQLRAQIRGPYFESMTESFYHGADRSPLLRSLLLSIGVYLGTIGANGGFVCLEFFFFFVEGLLI